MHAKQVLKRGLSRLLVLAMAFSMLAGTLPLTSVTAEAAAVPVGLDAQGKHLYIQTLDSDVYGADSDTETDRAVDDYDAGWKDKVWKDKHVTDFLGEPEGLTTMDERHFIVYDLGVDAKDSDLSNIAKFLNDKKSELGNGGLASGKDNCYVTSGTSTYISIACLGGEDKHNGHLSHVTSKKVTGTAKTIQDGNLKKTYMDIDLSKDDFLKSDHMYVIVEDWSQQPGYGYLLNTAAGRDLLEGSDRGWELIFKWHKSDEHPKNQFIVCDIDPENGKWRSYDSVGTDDNEAVGKGNQPLHNEPARGGFKFLVKDLEAEQYDGKYDGMSQGVGDLDGAVFAVFNINENASKGSTTGYVTVDKDRNNSMSETEEQVFYPAYTYDTVVQAYEKYLSECMKADQLEDVTGKGNKSIAYNGIYGLDKDTLGVRGAGEKFVLGDGDDLVVPCMILKPEDGVVSTGARSLPVGNYLVLQVKSGAGYYIDENFRPVVTIGEFGDGSGTVYYGYGNVYPTEMHSSDYTNFRTNGQAKFVRSCPSPVYYVPAQSTDGIPMLGGTDGIFTVNDGSFGGSGALSSMPMREVYTDAGSDHYDAYPNGGKYVIETSNGDPVASGNQRFNQWGSGLDNTTVGFRRVPKLGYSRFTAWQAPMRAGIMLMLGDANDLKYNTSSGKYVGEPQGDGDFLGTVFRVRPYDDSVASTYFNMFLTAHKQEGITTWDSGDKHFALIGNQNMTHTGISYDYDESEYKEYTAQVDSNGQYYVNIPVDELPYGFYVITQVVTGEGYGNDNVERSADYDDWSAKHYEEVTVDGLWVYEENHTVANYGSDTMKSSDKEAIKKPYQRGTVQYLPQTLVRGGMLFTAEPGETVEDPNKVELEITVYNVSKHYVYVDQDKKGEDGKVADGAQSELTIKDKIPTANTVWNNRIMKDAMAARTVTYLNKVLSDSTFAKSKVYTTGHVTLGDLQDGIMADVYRNLPYGTYVMAVTYLTNGYTTTTPLIAMGTIGGTADEDSNPYDPEYDPDFEPATDNKSQLEFNVVVEDVSKVPEVHTTLLDAGYRIDSTPVKTAQGIVDRVELSNLLPNKTYYAYSVLVGADGQIIPGTGIVSQSLTGYIDSSHNPVDDQMASNLKGIVASGLSYNTVTGRSQSAYTAWLDSVSTITGSINDSLLPDLIAKAKEAANTDPQNDIFYNQVMARLRYLADPKDAQGSSLNGTAIVEMRHDNIDATKLAGQDVVGFLFLCQANEPNPAVLSATSVDAIRVAAGTSLKAQHYSLYDESQTVHIATLDISAQASLSGGKEIDPTETVKATITAGNLYPGNTYIVRAVLKDESGNNIKGADGNDLVVERSFRASGKSQVLDDVVFDGLDAAKYNGQRLTVYADLYRTVTTGGVTTEYWLVAKGDPDSLGYEAGGEDPGKNQVDVLAPTVTTVFTTFRGDKTANFDTDIALKDTVHYENLIPGSHYSAVLTVMTEDGQPAVDDNGKGITVTQDFIADTETKDLELVTLAISGKALEGMELVAYNDLYRTDNNKRIVVAEEHDLHDRSQTIYATGTTATVYISTTALSDETNSHYLPAFNGTKATDTVIIRNLEPETTYTLKTELAYAANGRTVTQFAPLTQTVQSDKDGLVRVDVPLTINSEIMAGEAIVVYETLFDAEGIETIAEHRDRADLSQTLYVSGLDTLATDEAGGSHLVEPVKTQHDDVSYKTDTNTGDLTQNVKTTYSYQATVRDRVWFDNLVPGNKYEVETTVVAQKNGVVVGSMTKNFTPKSSTGSFTVYIDLDVTNFVGQKLVVYETITDAYTGDIIAVHEDIDDEDQTVTILAPETETKPDETKPEETTKPSETTPPDNSGKPDNTGKDIQTGVDELYGRYFLIAAILAAIAAAGGFLYYWKKRRG